MNSIGMVTDVFTDSVNATLIRLRTQGLDVTETSFTSSRNGESSAYTTTYAGGDEDGFHWTFDDCIHEIIMLHQRSLDTRPYAIGFQRIPPNAMTVGLRRIETGEDLDFIDQSNREAMDPTRVTLIEEASRSGDMLLYLQAL